MNRWRAPSVAVVGLVLGCVSLVRLHGTEDVGLTVADGSVAVSFLVGGVVIERSPRERAMGWLLLCGGLAWLLPDVVDLASGVPADLLGLSLVLHRGLLAHAFLTFPGGRARTPAGRAVVGTSYLLAIVPGLWSGVWPTLVSSALLVCLLGISAGRRRTTTWSSTDAGTVVGCLFWAVVATLSVIRGDEPAVGPEHALALTYDATVLVAAVVIAVGARAQASLRGVTDLVVELGAGQTGGLEGRLRGALGDPMLQVGYWSAATRRFVDAGGIEISAERAPGRAVSVVRDQAGEPVAALVHDPALLEDPVLRSALEAATSLSIANSRLQAELRATLEATDESRRRLLRAADSEREQLDRRLQAGGARTLAGLGDDLALAASTASSATTKEQIARSTDTLERTLEDLARLAHGLNPRRLVDLGLNEALLELTTSSPVQVHANLEEVEADPATRTCLYFVCSEALANVAKHAPTATCRVSLGQRERVISLTVEDDGPGGASMRAGTGLAGLADRVETLGGRLSLTSAPGGGTRLTVLIPDRRTAES